MKNYGINIEDIEKCRGKYVVVSHRNIFVVGKILYFNGFDEYGCLLMQVEILTGDFKDEIVEKIGWASKDNIIYDDFNIALLRL